MFRKVLFGVVLGAAFLQASAQDPDEQILRLHAEGKLAEAVELCIQEAPYSTVAKYFLGEYYCHGIPGILEAIPARGREYYVKAFREIRDWYGAGASPREIRWAARCIEFGENDPETAKTWYLKAAKAGDTNSLPRILTYLEHQQITAEELEDIPIPEEMLTLEQKALLGILFLESWKKGDQGKAILFEAARAGHPKALARVAVLYYTGGYGMAQDWEKALQFMEEAVKKGIPAQELPLDEVRERVVQIRQKRYEDALQPPPVMPGDGYPGKRLPYPVSSDLQPWLERFNLTAGWFQRDDVHAKFLKSRGTDEVMTNAIPYLLYTPPKVRDPVPILIYFGGTGEHGTNLVDQFHQTAIFSKITDTEFQKKHPCYLFAPMVPKNSSLRCYKESSSDMADLVCDALYAIIRDAENPPVDINRMYLTGLSYGGSAAYTFPFGYPGRFAASLPVAGNASKEDVPENQIYNIWLLFNEDRYNTTETARRTVREIKAKVERQGGEFRASSFPGKDHNAWDKAWREDSVWDWLFSKTADGKPVPRIHDRLFEKCVICKSSHHEGFSIEPLDELPALRPIRQPGPVVVAPVCGRHDADPWGGQNPEFRSTACRLPRSDRVGGGYLARDDYFGGGGVFAAGARRTDDPFCDASADLLDDYGHQRSSGYEFGEYRVANALCRVVPGNFGCGTRQMFGRLPDRQDVRASGVVGIGCSPR